MPVGATFAIIVWLWLILRQLERLETVVTPPAPPRPRQLSPAESAYLADPESAREYHDRLSAWLDRRQKYEPQPPILPPPPAPAIRPRATGFGPFTTYQAIVLFPFVGLPLAIAAGAYLVAFVRWLAS